MNLYLMPEGKELAAFALSSPVGWPEPGDAVPEGTVPVRAVPLRHFATVLPIEAVARAAGDIVQLTLDRMCRDATERGLEPMTYRVSDSELDRWVVVHLWAAEVDR